VSSDYVTGTITGIIATTVGFILSTLYERRRSEKTEHDNRIKTVNLLVSELKDNLKIAEENLGLFTSNLQNLTQRAMSLIAPTFYFDSSWRIGQANGIASFIDGDTYKFLAETYVTITYMNAQFSARESFRIGNMALSSFQSILATYDQILQQKSALNIDRIKQAITKLELKKPETQEQKVTREEKPEQALKEEEPRGRGFDLFIGIIIGIIGSLLVSSIIEMVKDELSLASIPPATQLAYWILTFILSSIFTFEFLKIAMRKYFAPKRFLRVFGVFDIAILPLMGSGIFVYGFFASNFIVVVVGVLLIITGFCILLTKFRK
jgi:hypothetical protein